MNVCFETFGCRLNRAEALDEQARWVAAGHTVVASHAEADLIVVRGCSVTARAQHDCERLLAHLRSKYPDKRLRVCGCLTDAERGAPKIPGATANAAPVPTVTARAYLKVQDGCSGACTFCIVPRFRGKSVSTPFGEVLARARRFADAGYREIVLTGCNLAQYASGGHRLPELVAALASALPDCRFRLGSVEPGTVAAETVSAMATHANVCRFLHLAVQSGSNAILRAMRRPYTAEAAAENAALARRLMPNVALGCDLLVGFPGESDVDFQATQHLLVCHPFSNAHVFPFSPRPGTPAALMPHQTAPELRTARARALTVLGRKNRERLARTFVGKTVEIISEHRSRNAGWTGEYLWLEEDPHRAHPAAGRRQRLAMRVLRAEGGHLIGTCTEESDRGR